MTQDEVQETRGLPEARRAPAGGGFSDGDRRSRRESLGERLLGSLLDRAHLMPPRLIGPLVAQEVAGVGGRDVTVYLQDFDHAVLRPLAGTGLVGSAVPIDGSPAGDAFRTDSRQEVDQPDGSVRLYLPMLDGSDRVGVLALTLDRVDDTDRRLAQRLAGLVADLVVTKSGYTDTFVQARMTAPMSLSAHLQWQMLPPLVMTTPDVALAGALEPAYDVGGDSFDYALDGHTLHLAVFDAMGHGLEAATMATVLIAAYRHGRINGNPLTDIYAEMDGVLAGSYPGRFATAQLGRLDTTTGVLTWINAGHPAALLVRGKRVIGELTGPITRPRRSRRRRGAGELDPAASRATGCSSSPTASSRSACRTATSSASSGCASSSRPAPTWVCRLPRPCGCSPTPCSRGAAGAPATTRRC